MHIPKYWSSQGGAPPSGSPPWVDVWGWSDVSVADAEQVALRRLAEVIERAEAEGGLADHSDYYPRVPLREPVIATIAGEAEQLLALITRNRYGAEVLNTERLFVADVDVPEWEDREPGSGGGLFRRKVTSVDDAVARVQPVLAGATDLAWRICRTRAGLRVMADGSDLQPGSRRSSSLFTALGADPLYVQLTATYASYRARLSPKPWRIGLGQMPIGERQFEGDGLVDDQKWLAAYDRAAAKYAVCRLVVEGGRRFDAEVMPLIELHDELTGVASDLPLA